MLKSISLFPSTSVIQAPCALAITIGCGSYACKLDGTPRGSTFFALALAAWEPGVFSTYVRNSRCVICLALSAKLWCNVGFVADIGITPISGYDHATRLYQRQREIPDSLMKLGLCAVHGTLDARMVGVAQLVRALGCGPRGRGFESPRSPQIVGRYQFRYRRHEDLIGEHNALSPSVDPRNAPLAQLVEQRTLNPQVLGSIPRGRTTFHRRFSCLFLK